ncbi:MAG: sensor domain-containing protein [Actinomycetes bacterium]
MLQDEGQRSGGGEVLSDDERLRRFEALVHASPDFIAIAAVDGKVEFVNDAGRLLAGIGRDVDVTETSITDYLTPTGLEASVTVEQPAVVRDGYWTGETTLRDWRDGSDIPVTVTSFVLRDIDTGEPIAMATIQRDLREVRAAAAKAELAEAAMRSSERRQSALLRHMSDLVLVVDADLTLTYASPSLTRILGHPESSRLGTSVLGLVHPDERDRVRGMLEALIAEPGTGPAVRVRVVDTAGHCRLFEARSTNLLDAPDVHGIVITAHDVSATWAAEQSQQDVAHVLELIAREAPIPTVLQAITSWVERQTHGLRCTVLLTEAGVPVRVLRDGASSSMPDVYRDAVDGLPVGAEYSPCALAVERGQPVVVEDLLADNRWSRFHDLARQLNTRSCWSYPIDSPASGATLGSFALYSEHPLLPDPAVEALVARASNLVGIAVDRDRLVARLAHQARHDALTLLPNRLELLKRLTDALRQAQQGTAPAPVVLFFDLDRLKVINDSLGHDVGDELLLSLAQRLASAIGDEGLVARFGGDEFVVLSTRLVDLPDIEALAGRVLQVVSEPVRLGSRLLSPSASVGIVVATADQTATGVLRDADIAMYRAKQGGGNRVEVFGAHMRQRAFDRLDLEGEIRDGIAAGEFRVHYQPLVDLRADDQIVGFEALVRWQHPTRGLLAPDAFLQMAEETDLIVPLGEWVLRTVAATARTWQQEISIPDLTLSVNVSARQLSSTALLSLVAECVRDLGPWTLALELTESTLMDDATAALETLNALAAAGGRISIDDFGTGFSSLSYLTLLPVQSLKIDRSFVSALGPDAHAATTVTAAILGLARQLGLRAVAEGIETHAQRQHLVDLGCPIGQGYLFGHAVDEDTALALLLFQAEASGAGRGNGPAQR